MCEGSSEDCHPRRYKTAPKVRSIKSIQWYRHMLMHYRSYLESHGKDAIVKPWLWIVWLGVSPMLNTLGQQLYIFISVGQYLCL